MTSDLNDVRFIYEETKSKMKVDFKLCLKY